MKETTANAGKNESASLQKYTARASQAKLQPEAEIDSQNGLMLQRMGRGCRSSQEDLQAELAVMPFPARRSAAMSLQKSRGNRFMQGLALQAKPDPNRTGMLEGREPLEGVLAPVQCAGRGQGALHEALLAPTKSDAADVFYRPPLAACPRPVAGVGAGAVVQRLLAAAVPNGAPQLTLTTALTPNPKAMARFTHGEVLSNEWGANSYTGNFTNANGSDHIDGDKDLTYNGVRIGYLRPLGTITAGRFDPHVKMHLVNSFLHPCGNTVAENWVFGSHWLNAQHTPIEAAAKALHPHEDDTKAGLSYRTTVTAMDNTATTQDDLATEIKAGIDRNTPVGWGGVSLNRVRMHAMVDATPLAGYAANWTGAVLNAVGVGINVEYQAYSIDGAGKVLANGVRAIPAAVMVGEARYRAVVEAQGEALTRAGAITMPVGRTKRKAPTGGVSGSVGSKKLKV